MEGARQLVVEIVAVCQAEARRVLARAGFARLVTYASEWPTKGLNGAPVTRDVSRPARTRQSRLFGERRTDEDASCLRRLPCN